ncbi:hybrid sensor histidine kinase/response regulator transcription factor [Plebeiibacterium sediminum]|uniref:histidine kinase n=1 Tax=Plebeiibacterium sediminum TaxID=2992112 RepID=A0AAE3SFU9_9BACT|nr:hybrid sensor histidine kinase/response regulator transcription factor [Plebeiobacterium sediminum]MCW3786588.1 response regulator [Plebeiobacterium sediminum]
MRNRLLFITICYFLLSFNAKCENIYTIENLTTKNGLSQNTITSLAQDRQGFLWFGSLNGLNRFDGNSFLCLQPEYGTNNTLSDSRIKDIQIDAHGYLWIRTNINNINCYNPVSESFMNIHPWSTQHENVLFTKNGDIWFYGNRTGCLRVVHAENNISTYFYGFRELDDYAVNFIIEDNEGKIWIGTNTGLYIFDNEHPKLVTNGSNFHSSIEVDSTLYVFTNNDKIYTIDKTSRKVISEVPHIFNKHDGHINSTTLLPDNNILITTNNTPYIFNTKTKYFSSAKKMFKNQSILNAFIQYDNKNNIWVYNKSGIIWQYDYQKNIFKANKLIPPSIVSNIDMERYSIFHDSRNIIWITTYGNGLFAIDQTDGSIKHFIHNENQQEGLKTNYLLSVYEDKSGNIWVGSEYAGLSKITISENKYPTFYPGSAPIKKEDKIIRLIYEDSDKNLWIGTKSGSLFIYDRENNLIAHHHLKGGMPYTISEDRNGNKWIGTKGNGLIIFNNNEYHIFKSYNKEFLQLDPHAINIYDAYLDNKERMWLGTYGYGLILAEIRNNQLVLQDFPNLLKFQSRIRTIEQDKDSLIWIGGNNGITVFDPDLLIKNRAKIKNYYFDNQNDSSLNNNEVKDIFKDSSGQMWIGTSGGGINKVIQDGKLKNIRFKHLTTNDGLINNIIQGIKEDNSQNLWITTESGISLLQPQTGYFENYHLANNWEGDLFCESAIIKNASGKMLLGSYNGLYTISPDELNYHIKKEIVTLTELRINGIKSVPGDENSPLSQSISNTANIKLPYNQNSLNIKFSVLNYKSSNLYTFMLDGYDSNWNSSTQHNEATYRNIPPGSYTFRVKINNSGNNIQQEETVLYITIEKPFWKTTLAVIIYIIILLMIAFIIIRTNKKISSLSTAVKLEQQLTDYKLRFFTNISHEFRTPLTIIKGTIENLVSNPDITKPIKKQINYLERSSNRLLRLINQLLDYQKLQHENLALDLKVTEIDTFFREIYENFEQVATRKNITYQYASTHSYYQLILDRNKIEKVVYNLLSNAFKFTPENGNIQLHIEINEGTNELIFSIIDNGEGVAPKDQNMLFTRFAQIKPSESGTGIGLNYAYELVKIHKGHIKYKDTPQGGATFIVSIPILKEDALPTADPTQIDESKANDYRTLEHSNSIDKKRLVPTIEVGDKYKNYKVLIIEDDLEVSDYLEDYLQHYFDVETAIDGLEGLKKCSLINPQLIICDATMPNLNGYEVIKRIKSDFKTCHIPIIMLTAHATPQHQIKGIESGADSYITKPFDSKYLLTRIIKLLEQREILHQKFANEPGLVIEPNLPVDKDNEFIKKINLIIDKNLDNAEFSIDDFYEKMSMGRTLFYKKVKSLTGFTPNEYLRVIRMKKAAELLLSTDLNVSEVAFKVGNNNPFYFSKCFKNQFGVAPSEYAKSSKNKPTE